MSINHAQQEGFLNEQHERNLNHKLIRDEINIRCLKDIPDVLGNTHIQSGDPQEELDQEVIEEQSANLMNHPLPGRRKKMKNSRKIR